MYYWDTDSINSVLSGQEIQGLKVESEISYAGGKTFMTVKELYYASNLIGPILLSYSRIGVFGEGSVDEKIYPNPNELKYDFSYIGDFKITHIQATNGRLTLLIEKPKA